MSLDRRALLRHSLTAGVISAGIAPAAGLVPAAAATTRVRPPRMYSTRHWHARPPAEEVVIEDYPPTYIVVHHTVEPGNTEDASLERAFAISRSIQNFHMDSRGWIDSGQQFTISRGGYITEGRHRSVEILREGKRHVQGTNVANHNSQIIGIENEGLYTEEDVPDALWESLVDLVSYMAYQYSVPPDLIKGHRDFNSTQCPGDVLYARLPELRAAVAERLGIPARRGSTEWPLLRPGARGEHVRIGQRLLRSSGARSVPVDGVYGEQTQEAVAALATRHGLDANTCGASAHTEERGLLGADIWPLLVTGERSVAEWKALLTR